MRIYGDDISLILTDEWFEEQNNIAIKNLGDRYLPDVNVTLEINRVFNGLERNGSFQESLLSYFDVMLIALNKIKDEEIIISVKTITTIVETIPFNSIESFECKPINELVTKIVYRLEKIERAIKDEKSGNNDYGLYNIRQGFQIEQMLE